MTQFSLWLHAREKLGNGSQNGLESLRLQGDLVCRHSAFLFQYNRHTFYLYFHLLLNRLREIMPLLHRKQPCPLAASPLGQC